MKPDELIEGPVMILRASGWEDYDNLVPVGVYCDEEEQYPDGKSRVSEISKMSESGETSVVYFVDSDWPGSNVTSGTALLFAENLIKKNGWPRNYESMLAAWNNLFLG